MTRQSTGGFEPRFIVTRTDGKPCRPEARYFVMDYAGDPHASAALEAYAASIEGVNAQLASDIRAALVSPTDWPAQHSPTPPIEGRDADVERVADEMFAIVGRVRRAECTYEEGHAAIRAALQALGERG